MGQRITALVSAGSQDEEVLMLHKSSHLALWRFPAMQQQAIPTTSDLQQTSKHKSDGHRPSGSARQQSHAQASTSVSSSDAEAKAALQDTDPQLLTYTTLPYKAYSAARSLDGRLVAAGKQSLCVPLPTCPCNEAVLGQLHAT